MVWDFKRGDFNKLRNLLSVNSRWDSVFCKDNINYRTCEFMDIFEKVCGLVCWSLTSLCHSNGHIETMPAREINPFTALTRIRSQFLRTQ